MQNIGFNTSGFGFVTNTNNQEKDSAEISSNASRKVNKKCLCIFSSLAHGRQDLQKLSRLEFRKIKDIVDQIVLALFDLLKVCSEALQKIMHLVLGFYSTIFLFLPYLLAASITEGKSVTIPLLWSSTKIPLIGSYFLSFMLSSRIPHSTFVQPTIDSYKIKGYSCKVTASVRNVCFTLSNELKFPLLIYSSLAQFATIICVESLTEKLKSSGIQSLLTGLAIWSLEDTNGAPYTTCVVYDMRKVIEGLKEKPRKPSYQTLECKIRDKSGTTVAIVLVKFSFLHPKESVNCKRQFARSRR